MINGTLTLVGGFLTALLLFFGTIGLSFEWFTQESIDAFVIVVGAIIALVINLRAVWKNTYVSKKAQAQKEVLHAHGLIQEEASFIRWLLLFLSKVRLKK